MKRVTCAAAARVLGVHKSTVTRWTKKHPALLDEDSRVSVDELRAHRDQVINPALQTRGPKAVPALPEPVADTGDAAPSAKSDATPLNSSRARSEAAKADEAELNLADRLGETLIRREVEDALANAVERMRQRGDQLARDRGEKIAVLDDVRAVEQALDALMHELFTQMAQEFMAIGARDDDTAAA